MLVLYVKKECPAVIARYSVSVRRCFQWWCSAPAGSPANIHIDEHYSLRESCKSDNTKIAIMQRVVKISLL